LTPRKPMSALCHYWTSGCPFNCLIDAYFVSDLPPSRIGEHRSRGEKSSKAALGSVF
jgi:hypothetical protein